MILPNHFCPFQQLISETRILRDVFNPKDFEIGHQTTKKRQTSQDIKKAKVEFVQKLINFAANNEQPVIGCVASKILAGLEPNKTNELLQSLARICQAKLSLSSNNARNSSATDRPRTFTRQLDSGVASRRQSSSRRASNEAGLSSAGSIKTATINKSKQQQQPQVKKELNIPSSSSLTIEQKLDNTIAAAPPLLNQPERQAVDIIQPARVPAKAAPIKEKPRQHHIISSESDIGKEIHHVRAHLKLIRSTLSDIIKQEATLRDALTISIQNSKRPNSNSSHQAELAEQVAQ